MKPHLFRNLSLFSVEIFLRCAELCNFTKVAAEYYITPGMVSKRICALEDALETSLFSRGKTGVELTVAGKELYHLWKPLVNSFFRSAETIGKNQEDTISFAIWESTNTERYFVPLISSYSAEEKLSFRIAMEESDEIIELLLNGKADILFAPKFVEEGIRRHPELCSLLVLPSPLCTAFSEDSPLMKIKNLHVEDLKESSVLIDDSSNLYIQMLYRIFWEHGLVPNLKSIEPGENMKSKFLQLAREDIIITDRYHFSYHSNALEYRDLPDTESGIIMLFKQDAPPHVRKFLKYARKFFLDLGTAGE